METSLAAAVPSPSGLLHALVTRQYMGGRYRPRGCRGYDALPKMRVFSVEPGGDRGDR